MYVFSDKEFSENGSFENWYLDGDINQTPDFPDTCLKFINDILMEEDLDDDNGIVSLKDYNALQATEKSLFDVLGGTHTSQDCVPQSFGCSSGSFLADSPISTLYMVKDFEGGKKSTCRKYDQSQSQSQNHGGLDERSRKLLAPNGDDYLEMEKFDDVLICKEGNDDISPCTRRMAVNDEVKGNGRRSRGKNKSRGKKKSSRVIDLRTLLTQCAQAVASFELTNANELLKQIRQYANQFGDSVERVAYYFANGLEARVAGTGSDSCKDFHGMQISSYDILKGYKLYVSAIPFQRTSYFLANQTIAKLARKATKIHIIDFGIFFGFQWPCLIQNLSRRPLGPPKLRITGVDYPTSGFKPAQKIEETGRRLDGYCQRFGVPFEFHAIAQLWHTLKPENFKIEKDELVVVTCLYQSRKLPDETVDGNSPRDYFLKLIKSLNPDLFIHGVVNGTFNAPFFNTRFREALYHYSCLFDIFDAAVPREDHERLLIEKYLYGSAVMNIVACEGSERIERPESYKQWMIRQQRAGFKQVPVDQDIVNRARAMVKANYRKDFMVEQDKDWIVQGWKGRILSAISCWKSA